MTDLKAECMNYIDRRRASLMEQGMSDRLAWEVGNVEFNYRLAKGKLPPIAFLRTADEDIPVNVPGLQGGELFAFLRQQLGTAKGGESIGFGASYAPPHDDEIVVYFGTPDFIYVVETNVSRTADGSYTFGPYRVVS